MNKVIYICKDCPSCEKVVAFVTSRNIEVQVVTLGDEAVNQPAISIFPAYYEGSKLMAYGEDIILRLESAA